ncbi:MAG: hypothetical protein NT093_04175, partial [Candidatus Moranbacteria bacterium]|nr:hypothetical protein [Candidatus Moranbacteria bacterium]
MNNNKSNKTIVIVLIALLLLTFLLIAAAAGIGFFVWKKYSDQKEKQTQALEQQIRNLESAFGNSQKVSNQSSSQTTNSSEAKNTSACSQNFTNEENLNKADWKTFTNTKYGYSFQYPKNWIVGEKQDDYTGLGSGADQQSFEWRSDIMTGTDYYGFKEDRHKNMTVGCANAKITYFSGDPTADPPEDSQNRLVLVEFEKNGIP